MTGIAAVGQNRADIRAKIHPVGGCGQQCARDGDSYADAVSAHGTTIVATAAPPRFALLREEWHQSPNLILARLHTVLGDLEGLRVADIVRGGPVARPSCLAPLVANRKAPLGF